MKYKYTRKEIWDNLTKFIRINTSTGRYAIDPDDWFKCRKDLLATKQEDNKDYRYVYCCPVHGEYYKVCPKCNPTPSPHKECCGGHSNGKSTYVDNMAKIYGVKVKHPTPSPLEIEKIEEYFYETSYDRKILNKLIRNQKKLYQYIKEKL